MAEVDHGGNPVKGEVRRTSPVRGSKSDKPRGKSSKPSGKKSSGTTSGAASGKPASGKSGGNSAKATESRPVGGARTSTARPVRGARTSEKSTGKNRGRGVFVGVLGAAIVAIVVAGLWISALVIGSKASDLKDASDQRAQYDAFARQMTLNLTTLNPQNIDQQIARFRQNTSGRALQQSDEFLQSAVPMIKEQKVTTKSEILSSAVEGFDSTEATVLLVYGWSSTSPNQPDPQLQTFRWKAQITRINGDMKLTNFEWVF